VLSGASTKRWRPPTSFVVLAHGCSVWPNIASPAQYVKFVADCEGWPGLGSSRERPFQTTGSGGAVSSGASGSTRPRARARASNADLWSGVGLVGCAAVVATPPDGRAASMVLQADWQLLNGRQLLKAQTQLPRPRAQMVVCLWSTGEQHICSSSCQSISTAKVALRIHWCTDEYHARMQDCKLPL
jgi:hypothetical protein